MVDEGLLSAEQVAQELGISLNNLRQIQFRSKKQGKGLIWAKKSGRSVYYNPVDVLNFKAERDKSRP